MRLHPKCILWLPVFLFCWCGEGAVLAQPLATAEGLKDFCLDEDLARGHGLSDLYCVNLVAVPGLKDASGFVRMIPTYSPFGVSVTRDGHHEYRLKFTIDGLPEPASLGSYQTYVAWATTPILHPMQKLGAVDNGTVTLDSVAFDKFLILITAERSADGAEREGKIVMRGSSPSNRMEAHDLAQIAPLAVFSSAHAHDSYEHGVWRMPPMHPAEGDYPGMAGVQPKVDPFMPGTGAAGRIEAAHTHDEAAHDAAAHAHVAATDDTVAHTHDATAAHAHDETAAHTHDETAAHTHDETAAHTHDKTATHTHDATAAHDAAAGAHDTAADVPTASDREHVMLAQGDVFDLESGFVRRRIDGKDLLMYGFNGQHPGPLLDVQQDSEVTVQFTNQTDLPSAIHWHGLRLDVRFDGVPLMTQKPVNRGESFAYRLTFPDPGIFWFHPHHREDIAMDLGLFANIVVRSPREDYFNPVNREEFLMLDDLLLDESGIVPYGRQSANFMLMGRFGNTFLINGKTDYSLGVQKGETVRFFVTNASSTRTYNLSFGDARLKLVGSDVGKFEREEWIDNVVIGPAERYVVEAHFEQPGTVAIENRVQAINHLRGTFFPEVDTLGIIHIAPEPAEPDLSGRFEHLRRHDDVIADIDAYRDEFDRAVDHHLTARLEVQNLPAVTHQMMRFDNIYINPVEWSGTMPMMNWATTGEEVRWILEDPETGKQNMDIDWQFELGDVVKIRLKNDRNAFHAMQHPIHIHGQRFLVLERDGVPVPNKVWKDTMILSPGTTADILLELSNPGKWMVHCHIAEHIDSGMMFVFDVR